MSTILTIASVETLMRMNSIPSNSQDSYNNKIDKLKNAGLLMKNIQYTNEPEKINTPESDRLVVVHKRANNQRFGFLPKPSGGNVINPVKSKIKYDQLISGDINITFNNDPGIYTITFLRNNPFTIYQVWSDTDDTINQTRNVRQLDAVSWIDTVFNITKKFTPTAIMDTFTERYIFIIKKVYINNNNKLVFETPGTGIIFQGCISTYLSNNLPLGTLMNVRFDIDSVSAPSPSITINQIVWTNYSYTLTEDLIISASETFTIQSGYTFINNGGTITNNGTILNNGTFTNQNPYVTNTLNPSVNDPYNQNFNPTYTNSNYTLINNGTFTNNGIFINTDSNFNLNSPYTALGILNNNVFTNNGTLTQNGGAITIGTNGIITNNNTFNNNNPIIPNPSNSSITDPNNPNYNPMYPNNNNTITNNGIFTNSNNSTFINNDPNVGILNNNVFTNNGSFTQNGGVIKNGTNGTITNKGTINNNNPIVGQNDGVANYTTSINTITNYGAFTNSGTFTTTDEWMGIANIGNITNKNDGIININVNGILYNYNQLINNGIINNITSSDVFGITNFGSFVNTSGAQIYNGNQNNFGSEIVNQTANNYAFYGIQNPPAISFTNEFGATIQNFGQIYIYQGSFTNSGRINLIGSNSPNQIYGFIYLSIQSKTEPRSVTITMNNTPTGLIVGFFNQSGIYGSIMNNSGSIALSDGFYYFPTVIGDNTAVILNRPAWTADGSTINIPQPTNG
jgi:hypothetical protein